MRRAFMQAINRPRRRRAKSRANRDCSHIHHRRLACEPLEDRRLLSTWNPIFDPTGYANFDGESGLGTTENFYFTPDRNGSATFTIDRGSTGGHLWLYDAEGNELEYVSESSGNVILTHYIQGHHSYHLKFDEYWIATGPYTATFQLPQPYPYDLTNNLDEQGDITTSEESIVPGTDGDYYEYVAPDYGTLTVEADDSRNWPGFDTDLFVFSWWEAIQDWWLYAYDIGSIDDGNLSFSVSEGSRWCFLVRSDVSRTSQLEGYFILYLDGPSNPDTTRPEASSSVSNITSGGGSTHSFTVRYTDNVAVDVSDLDSSDIRVTGPNGFSQNATFVSVDTNSDGTPRTATYRINAPGGTWDSTDNGTYTASMQYHQVSDTSGNYVLSGSLDTFNVNIPITLSSVTISGDTSPDESSTEDYTLRAYYDDGSNRDVTSSASWSENSSYASINSSGRLTTSSVSSNQPCRITASYGGKSDTHDVTIQNIAAVLTRVTISGDTSPDESSTEDYTLRAYYSDGSSQNMTSSASWSENSSYATINSSGRLTTSAVSSDQPCRITASYGGKSDTHDVTIQNIAASLTHVTISGDTSPDESSTEDYTLRAYYDDGSNRDVTSSASWSENSSYADIGSSTGRLTTYSVTSDQPCRITASYGGKTDTHDVTIKDISYPWIIDDGDAGHQFVGSWGRGGLLGTYSGDYWYDERGTGSEKSIWTFTGLASGNYEVLTTWAPHSNRATNAPFTLSGGSQQTTVRVNQEVAPNDTSSNGVWWESLGTITVNSSGMLIVTLTDDANQYVIADAVWVRPAESGGDSYEPDDSAGQAKPIATNGTSQTRSIYVGSDVDWMEFTLPQLSDVTIETNGTSGDTRMWLFGPNSPTNQIEYDDDDGNGLFSKITRTGGNALEPGTYFVKIDEYGNNDTIDSYTITVTATPAGAVSRIIDGGDAGHRFVGSWGRGGLSGAYNGNYWYDERGTGSEKSIWTFADLAPGNYEVLASWTAHANRATNAPFTISNGADQTTVRKNQEVAPSGELAHGVRWEPIGTCVLDAQGTIIVTLSDDANEYVIADAVWVRSASPLLAAGGEVLSARNAAPLAGTDLQPIIDEALSRWAQLDLPDELVNRLERTEFVVADLPGSNLGLAFSDTIYIDCDAAGHGWFIDSTPDEDEEFAALPRSRDLFSIDPRAVDRIDLLTVVSHELGHIAGLDDLDFSTHSLMSGELGTGVRRVAGQLEIDTVFASNDWDAE